MNARTYSFSHDSVLCLRNRFVLLQTNNMNLTSSENSHSSVNNQLRHMVSIYLDKHPGLTLNALSGRCGVPATTMRRLMQKSDSGELAPHSVLALVSYLLKEKKISSLLKKVDGPVADLLNRSFDQFIFDEKSSAHEMHSDLNTLFQDKTMYLIYKLAANACGTSVREIKNVFGLQGLQKLQELVDQNWIVLEAESDRLHAREKNFSVDLALAHQLTHSLVDFYKPRDVEKGFNLFYSLSEGMSEEGIKMIKEIEKNAVKKIFDLMNDKNLQGNIPYYAVVLSDVLGLTPNQESTVGVLQ